MLHVRPTILPCLRETIGKGMNRLMPDTLLSSARRAGGSGLHSLGTGRTGMRNAEGFEEQERPCLRKTHKPVLR
jgi:hypothetical protein